MSTTVATAPSPSATFFPPPNVQLSYGPMLIGVFVNMILYGILLSQTFSYYRLYKSDALWIKCLVLYLFIVETANTGIDMVMMYQPLILEYGHKLDAFPVMFAAEPITIVAISMPIQLFFAWRIFRLTKQSIIAIVISILSLVSFAGGLWTTIKIIIIKSFSRKPELHWSALVWFLAATVADVLITVTLVINLSKRKTGFSATDDAISKIIRMTVQTGMLTALFAIGDVVFFMSEVFSFVNFIWDLALTKIYANCLMSTLNARASLKEMTSGHSNQRHFSSTPGSSRRLNTTTDPMSPLRVQSHMFELGNVSYEKSSRSQYDDPEYGITVTRVVETIPDQESRKPQAVAL
ncbi:hypothetical protein AGABI1DRAFT_112209 [Agaricus bisporus var. burnettii JB137-S8]|uniref:DUF6534 domain-containing protein n=1 Tax=Agaricus bisporus var. burnettii (strain JB137-S8 / ATCC MYA-4627 / FGSC 10392) TaxID=597362 RepID=K5XFS3_AGABU|nr:uncharacterized protein AGABI1DRAFT_112209 [Agaricus bisporus var. burnettii JB137-S8]EKM82062.1 hypothetical protein AGABI1DRAFT_112209 [Agaricus bisporus var. burnettii JB137-S8]